MNSTRTDYNCQIYRELGVGSRTHAVSCARALDLLERDDEVGPPLPTTFLAQNTTFPLETMRFIGRKRETAKLR